ncbi:hypothetical protein BDW59DRAFT_107226 [Aspergillus cavernicola]|uniref:WSC domain-containing protein n=1 Tax=Aspergillus cavernicola TaxID=176166 RepID=A0ABR4I3J3_9EURO
MNQQLSLPLLILLAWATLWMTADSSITYCSTVSTGTSGSSNFSIYQSNGNCEDHCSGSAFGILLDKNCWCSDIAPNDATNLDTSDCDDDCPGFPDDSCGNATETLYAYIQLGNPSGTASVSSTSSTVDSTTSTTSTTSDATTTSHSSIVETHGSQVTTITVGDSAATSEADSGNGSDDEGSNSSISGGTIAGIVVGVVGGIALLVAAIIFFIAKRRSRSEDSKEAIDGRQSKGSQMSQANANGAFSDSHSHTWSNGSSVPQRKPTFTDNRLNTGAMLSPNGRRHSDVSLQDNTDYSRPVLRLTNPD